MKAFFKTFACVTVVPIAFISCDTSNNNNELDLPSSSSFYLSSSSVKYNSFCEDPQSYENEMPIMDCRVVSYKRNALSSNDLRQGFIANKDSLKLIFPHIFEEELAECNYFAIYLKNYDLSYWILSQEMVLYLIYPYNTDECGKTLDIRPASAMLICDNTPEGNLKDKIDLNSIRSYADLDWNCREENEHYKNAFF